MDPVTGKFDNKWDSDTLRPFALSYLKVSAKFTSNKTQNITNLNLLQKQRRKEGVKAIIPRYYKDKIFTEEERKQLASIVAEQMKMNQSTRVSNFQKTIQ